MHKPESNYQGDAWKYFLDLVRHKGVAIEGWGQYPFDRGTISEIAGWITGQDYSGMETHLSGYGDNSRYISHAEPRLPAANAAVVIYNFNIISCII